MMRMGLKVLALVGLGALSTSCRNFNPKDYTSPQGIAKATRTAVNTGKDWNRCDKLHANPSVQEEYALGGALAIHFVQRGDGLLLKGPGQALHVYLNTVGKNLAAQSARPTLEWTFGVLEDTAQFNAVSAPGGYVFVTRKLLQGVENEAQLAGVLAHEIAHITLKHAIHHYGSVKVNACRLVIGGKLIISDTAAARLMRSVEGDGTLELDQDAGLLGYLSEKTVELVEKGNSREQEFEADRIAVELMLSAGYDPQAYLALLDKTADGGGAFANHPKKKDRQDHIRAHVQSLKKSDGEFSGLATTGLRSPPLSPAFAAVHGGNSTRGVAKDGK